MFNASTVMHHNVYVFYMSLLLITFVNLRSLIKLEVGKKDSFTGYFVLIAPLTSIFIKAACTAAGQWG